MENKISFKSPQFYNYRFKLLANLALLGSGILAGLICSGLGIGLFFAARHFWGINNPQFIRSAYLFFLIFVFCSAWLIPLISGNHLIEKHFEQNGKNMVAQITFQPRPIKGFEAFLDSADDVGVFEIRDEALVFNGDSSEMVIAKDSIESVQFKYVEIRAFYLVGKSSIFKLKQPVDGISGFTLLPREGKYLTEFWKRNRLFQEKVKGLGLGKQV